MRTLEVSDVNDRLRSGCEWRLCPPAEKHPPLCKRPRSCRCRCGSFACRAMGQAMRGMSDLFKTCHDLRAQQPLRNRYCHGAWSTIIPLLVYSFGDEIASSLCTGVWRLGPKPGPVIQILAATDGRYFCSLKGHLQRLLRTETEPVHAWQDTEAPDRPAHQSDHSADERRHFMSAPVRDAACGEMPHNQAGQHRCAKTRHLETRAGCNIAWPTLPHEDNQCER